MDSPDRIREIVGTLSSEAVTLRHRLHQNPELSGQEEKTSALVAERLRLLGLDEVKTDIAGHGVIGILRGPVDGPTIALRADMDALPIQEENDVPYRSCKPGVMHACGHDGHTATLLGTAATLAQLRDRLQGSIRFIFQPAEETVAGATGMCEAGVMNGVDAVVALHGWPGLDVGKIGVRSGPMMASSDTFDILIKGRGAHAAMPHLGIDPIITGAQLVTALQTLSSREVSPVEAVVVTIAQFHAGTAYNIIPGTAELRGTVRCLTSALRAVMAERVERIVAGICQGMRAEYVFRYKYGTGVTVNDTNMSTLVAEVGAEALGPEGVVTLEHPSMGAEDFSAYLEYAPGVMFRLGVGAEMSNLHTPTYNFADQAVSQGMELFTRIALRYLDRESS